MPMRLLPLVPVLAAGLVLAACQTTRPDRPDERFGHRYEDEGPEGRRTILIEPAPDTLEYFTYPAILDTVHVRIAPFEPGEPSVPVEVLLKGSLPDACLELTSVQQERAGNLVNVRLDMRRPRRAVCASVVRPFRFYLPLEGRFEPGFYTLRVNDQVRPFEVRAPQPRGR